MTGKGCDENVSIGSGELTRTAVPNPQSRLSSYQRYLLLSKILLNRRLDVS